MKTTIKTFVLFFLFSNCSGDREENLQLAKQIFESPTETVSSETSTTEASTSITEASTSSSENTTTTSSKISLDINGRCICPNAKDGDTEEINGIVYTAVDNRSSLRTEVDAKNYNLCTTLVTDMSHIFQDKGSLDRKSVV